MQTETQQARAIRLGNLATQPEPWNNVPPSINEANRLFIRQWCIAGGIPVNWALKAQDYQLETAWKIWNYFAKVRGLAPEEVGRRRRRGSAPTASVSLDELDEPSLAAEATTRPEPRSIPTLTDSTVQIASGGAAEAQSAAPPSADLDRLLNASIDRMSAAAERVIGSKLDAAKVELYAIVERQVKDQLRAAIDSASLSERVKSQIRDLATDATAKMIAELVPRAVTVSLPAQPPRTLAAEPRHRAFDEIVSWLASGEHVYIVGGAGTGKTHLFKQVAEALGYDLESEFFPIDQSMTKYDVKGYKNPQGDYVPTAVYQAVKTGGLMCIDEGDMWAAAALGSLNSILANDFGVFGDELVRVHPRFRCIVAANTFGRGATAEFIGRNPLDAASLDRFAYVIVDYDESLEKQIHGLDAWTLYVQRVRAAVAELKIRHVVSMRATSRVKRGLAAGLDVERVLASALWRGLDKDSIAKIQAKAGPPPSLPSEAQSEPQAAAAPSVTEMQNMIGRIAYEQFLDALHEDKFITAIRIFREFHSNRFGLTEARDWVDDFRAGRLTRDFVTFINPRLMVEEEAA